MDFAIASVWAAMTYQRSLKGLFTRCQIDLCLVNDRWLSASLFATRIICISFLGVFREIVIKVCGVIDLHFNYKVFQMICSSELHIETFTGSGSRNTVHHGLILCRQIKPVIIYYSTGVAPVRQRLFSAVAFAICQSCVAILCETYTVER